MKKITIKVFSAFAGFDTQFIAFKKYEKWFNDANTEGCRIEFKLVGWCEIDPYAIQCHNALFPKAAKCHFPDITKIDWNRVPSFDVLFYSSCCQSITRTGAQKGMTEGSGTPSSLIWYIRDAIRIKKPKVCILENVPALLENKFVGQFEKWSDALEELGYRNTWSTLCAADYGVPQNRDRVFLVSVREDLQKRVNFPCSIGCHNSAEKFLERKKVDNKYYFSEEDAMKFLLAVNGKTTNVTTHPQFEDGDKLVKKICALSCKEYEETKLHVVPTLVADKNYEKVTYERMLSSAHYPRIGVLEVWEKSINVEFSYKQVLDGDSSNKKDKFRIINASLSAINGQVTKLGSNQYLRLRRSTPHEWFMLMGVPNDAIKKLISSGVPEAQLYKMAGNAIVVPVLEHLYATIFSDIHTWWNTPFAQ